MKIGRGVGLTGRGASGAGAPVVDMNALLVGATRQAAGGELISATLAAPLPAGYRLLYSVLGTPDPAQIGSGTEVATHEGGGVYLSDRRFGLGGTVTLRVRVQHIASGALSDTVTFASITIPNIAAPAASTPASLSVSGRVVTIDEGVWTASPTLSITLTADAVDVTDEIVGSTWTAPGEAEVAIALTVTADNRIAEPSAVGGFRSSVGGTATSSDTDTVAAVVALVIPEVVGQTHSNTWGSGAKTMTVSRGGETGPLLAVVQTAFTGTGLSSVVINGGTPLADGDRVTGAALTGQLIRTYVQAVDAGTGDVSVVLTSADGNKAKFGASVYLVKNATGATFEAESASTVSSTLPDNVVALDIPDHGVGFFSAYTADGSSSGRGSVLGGDEAFEGQFWASGSVRREARARNRSVGIRYDGEPGNRLVTAISFAGVDSAETVRVSGVTPLAAHGRGLARTVYAGLAAQIDLREFHYGQQGTLSYALAGGETLPAGLSLVGAHVEGIPAIVAAQTTVDFTVSRSETGESITISVPITVAAASAAGQLAGAAPIGFTPSGATYTLNAGVYDLQFGGTSPANGHQRYGSIGLSGLTPGVAYEVLARVRYTPGSTAAAAQFRVMQRDVAINYTSSETEDDASAWLGIIAKTPLTPVANGVEQTRVVRLTFVPGRSTAAIQIGKFEYLADGAFSVVQAGSVANDRYIIDGLLVREADHQIAAGALATVDAVREGHALFVFDKPRAVRRHVSGIGHTVISPEADPAELSRTEPQWGESNNRDPGEYQRHGGAVDWGSRPIEARYGEPGQPFDPRAGSTPSSPIMRYDFTRNADPGYVGAPLIFKAGVGEGAAGSFTKGFVRPDAERLQQQDRSAVWATYTLTVAQADPGAQAFQPPSATPAAAHKTLADLVPGWRDLIATAPRPAASSETFDYDELMFYLIGDSAATGYFNTPDQRNTPYLHRRDYGEQQSERWNKVFRALMTTPDTAGALTSAQWDAVAIRFLQLGITVDGNAQVGRWIPNGGGSSNYKAIATFAAVAFADAAMQARLDGDAATPRYADDRFISSIGSGIIAPAYYPPDYQGGNTQRPRSPFFAWQLGQPQWRNTGISGSDDDGDTYQSIHSSLSLDGVLFVHRLTGAAALWRQNVLDWYDRWFARALPGRLLSSNARDVPAETIPYWQALRAQGKPISAHRWGLTDDGTTSSSAAVDPTGRDWGSANANPSANARGWPKLRTWNGGGSLDLRQEFNARLGLLDGAPASFAITAARDAAGDSITVPAWVEIASDGYTLEATPPDSSLVFIDVTGTAGAFSDVATIAVHIAVPVATVAPSISGTAVVGQTLTVADGTWTNSLGVWTGSTITYARQWLRDGAVISGATGATYTLTDADQGRGVSCLVTATNPYGANAVAASAVLVAAKYAAVTGGYLTRASTLGLGTATRATFAGRIKLPTGNASAFTIFEIDTGSSLRVTPGGAIGAVWTGNAASIANGNKFSNELVNDGAWHTVVALIDQTTTPRKAEIWIDGVLATLVNSSEPAATPLVGDKANGYGVLCQDVGTETLPAGGAVEWVYVNIGEAHPGTAFVGVDPATVGTPDLFFGGALADWTSPPSGFTPTGTFTVVNTLGVERATTAFPGALGPGGLTLGAYATTDAPTIRRVKNLNNSGADSFAAAVAGNDPKIVVFDVGGNIVLTDIPDIGGNTTIIGETAPEPVTFQRSNPRVQAGQVVISGFAGRAGDDLPGQAIDTRDCFQIAPVDGVPISNVIVSNCSFTFGPDECINTWQAADGSNVSKITFQENIFAEGFVSPLHSNNPAERHNFGPYIAANDYAAGPREITFARNLLSTFRNRSPGYRRDHNVVTAENLIYNWQNAGFEAYGTDGANDIINNYFLPGPQTGTTVKPRAIRFATGSTGTYYVAGNVTPTDADPDAMDVVSNGGSVVIETSAQCAAVYTPTLTAAQARDHVLAKAGARRNGALDSIDARIVLNVQTLGPVSPLAGSDPDGDVTDFRDYDDYNATLGRPSRADFNEDGIVDDYETAMGVPVGSLHPHAIINAAAQGLDAKWSGHRQMTHQAHWMATGQLDEA